MNRVRRTIRLGAFIQEGMIPNSQLKSQYIYDCKWGPSVFIRSPAVTRLRRSWHFLNRHHQYRHRYPTIRETIPDPGGTPMDSLLGFKPDAWDYVALGSILALVVAGLAVAVFVLGLPGRIAIARKHPEAEAVNLMGWVGCLAVVPWIKALGWAFKPTDVIDVRYFPQQEQQNITEEIAKLKGAKLKEKPLSNVVRQPDHLEPANDVKG
jgi:hypothetical protein